MDISLRVSFLIMALALAPIANASDEVFFGALNDAWHGSARWPLLDVHYPAPTIAQAYEVQTQFIYGLHEEIVGFKAGLTSPQARKRFGADQAVAGVLLEGMAATAVIDAREFSELMIEVEIGFILSEAIADPITDPKALRRVIGSVVPVVELPDPGFDEGGSLTVVNIIAANVSARKFVVGKSHLPDMDANRVRVRLLQDGKEVSSGTGSDAMADQYEALMWLVNRTLESGYEIRKGHLFITGALGPMVPGPAGIYVADYDGLEDIRFEIR